MRTCFIVWDTSLSGGTRAIFEVANRLFERGFSIEVMALGGDHRWFNVKVPIRYVSLTKFSRSILLLYKLVRLRRLRRRRPDALLMDGLMSKFFYHADLIRLVAENIPNADVHIATWYPTSLALWLAKVESKKLYFLQDFPELVYETGGLYGLKMFDLSLRIPFDGFLCNSNYTKSLVLKCNKLAKTVVTGIGVDTRVFRPSNKKIVDFGKRSVVMIILGEQKYKGADVAIRTLNIVAQSLPLKVIVVGSRNAINRWFKLVRPQFVYDWFESVDDYTLAKLYSSADVFLFTSRAEGFGLPPLEAMACGTPVVTTDCKGNRDYVIDGVNSLVVPADDAEMAAKAIIRVLTEKGLRERLVRGGLETARQWSWDKVVDKFEQAIKER